MFLGRFFLLRLAQCGLCIFLLVLRNCGCVVIRALLCLNPQLFAPAPHFLFRHQSHIFRGGDFCPPPSCQRGFVINRGAHAARGTRESLI